MPNHLQKHTKHKNLTHYLNNDNIINNTCTHYTRTHVLSDSAPRAAGVVGESRAAVSKACVQVPFESAGDQNRAGRPPHVHALVRIKMNGQKNPLLSHRAAGSHKPTELNHPTQVLCVLRPLLAHAGKSAKYVRALPRTRCNNLHNPRQPQ